MPSESEWEYAAKGAGEAEFDEYPWGTGSPECDNVVMSDYELGFGCGMFRTWPSCSKTPGNTVQGLCDMAGNVAEWIQD
ncbi:MAG: formylglycine-generating enzyme family protein [Deltaproteobacteria bacterium]|nr:formylglycine-generating enzyme family protein [Deltaproteobacteria bacterium]